MIKTHIGHVYDVVNKAVDGRNILQAHLRCADCRRVDPINIHPGMAPAGVRRKFAQHGWHVSEKDRSTCLCPRCKQLKKEKRNAPMSAPVTKLHQPEAIIPMPPMPVLAKIVVMIDENFDKEGGAYIGKVDDKIIAAHFNVGFAVVARIREESGYKIKGDPAVIALRNELDALLAMGKDLSDKLAKLEARS